MYMEWDLRVTVKPKWSQTCRAWRPWVTSVSVPSADVQYTNLFGILLCVNSTLPTQHTTFKITAVYIYVRAVKWKDQTKNQQRMYINILISFSLYSSRSYFWTCLRVTGNKSRLSWNNYIEFCESKYTVCHYYTIMHNSPYLKFVSAYRYCAVKPGILLESKAITE